MGHVGFFGIFVVLNVFHQVFTGFLTCSQSFQTVPQHVPNSTSVCQISFALSFTPLMHIKAAQKEETTIGVSILELSKARLIFKFLNFWVMDQSMMPPSQKEKKKKNELWGSN